MSCTALLAALPVLLLLAVSTVHAGEMPNHRSRPILFVENNARVVDASGVRRDDILYTATVPGARFFFGRTGVSVLFEQRIAADGFSEAAGMATAVRSGERISGWRIDLDLAEGSSAVELLGESPTGAVERFYHGSSFSIALSYRQLRYRDIHKGIDLLVDGSDGALRLRYDIHGGDPDDIRLRVRGADHASGCRFIGGPGEIRIDGATSTHSLQGAFVRPLRLSQSVAPTMTLLWSTYYGGTTSGDYGEAIAVDRLGNVITAGTTLNSDFPVTTGAFQAQLSDGYDAFIVKMDSSGARLWATFYGGKHWERLEAITCDRSGNIAIAGSTESIDLPLLPGAFMTRQGSYDGYREISISRRSTGAGGA